MEEIEPGSVDLIVTSPPYGLGLEYEEKASLADYCTFIDLWVKELPRILSDKGQLWLNVGFGRFRTNQLLPLTYLYYRRIQLHFLQEIVWQFDTGGVQRRKFPNRTERWMWYCKDPSNYTFNVDLIRIQPENDDKRNNPVGKSPTDLWYFHHVTATGPCKDEKTEHPCQFPQSMIQRIVTLCSEPGDSVLDPFAGSGTVGVICKLLKRDCTLIEIEPRYCDIAADRIAAANPLTLL